MGMSASQGNLLFLTARSNDIGRQLMLLSNEKDILARDMQKISREYQEDLNAKVLKWSNNGGVSYVDLTYNNLMKPSAMNQYKAYLLTDTNGKIVVDSSYEKYAAMVSPDGSPNGDWESVRTKVLAEITGISGEDIDKMDSYQLAVWQNEEFAANLKNEEPKEPRKNLTTDKLLEKASDINGTAFKNGSQSWAKAYSSSDTVSLGKGSDAQTALDTILTSLYNQLAEVVDDPKNLKKAFETFSTGFDEHSDYGSSGGSITGKKDEGYTLDFRKMMDEIIGSYGFDSDNVSHDNGYGVTYINVPDKDSAKYTDWEAAHAEWQTQYDNSVSIYDESVKAKNELFTKDEEILLEFYDNIFSSIAEKGWTYNDQVNNTEYLNEMLQNNMYTFTTVDRDVEFDPRLNDYVWENEYSVDIASNFTNIFSVNDSDVREAALVEYENKKNIINAKEKRIDTRMKNLETEQAAIKQMIQGIEQVKNDNIERTFSTFS